MTHETPPVTTIKVDVTMEQLDLLYGLMVEEIPRTSEGSDEIQTLRDLFRESIDEMDDLNGEMGETAKHLRAAVVELKLARDVELKRTGEGQGDLDKMIWDLEDAITEAADVEHNSDETLFTPNNDEG